MGQSVVDRRRYERFSLDPMYTEVKVRRIRDNRLAKLSGYAYDISEGGLRIELEDRLDVGERVNLEVRLPTHLTATPELIVEASCEAVWVNDVADDPAMPRMALRVVRYFDESTRKRLMRFLGSGLASRVA